VAVCWLALPIAAGFAVDLWADGGRGAAALGSVVLGVAVTLAAPWVARGVAAVDEVAARALLGPGRADELTQRVQSLARSRAEIVAATDAERRRIERDLHDGTQQRLVSLAMHLGMARTSLTDADEPAREAIAKAHDEAVAALAELREFVRGLHPAVLNDRGLDAADWEFTFTLDGVSRHVLYRGIVTDGRTFGLYLSTPAQQWTQSANVFQVAATTFRTG